MLITNVNANMPTLTKRQKEILDFIKSYIKKNDFSPTFEEIKKHFKLKSVATIHEHIETLVEKNFLVKNSNSARGIELVKMKKELIDVPLSGFITAGQPVEAIEIPNETITIEKGNLQRTNKLFALKVEGNSMINEGIFDGDIVVLRQQNTAENGDTVVAIIDDNEATLKKIYKEESRIRLQPANPEMLPIFRKEVEVRGIVIKIIRNIENQNKEKVFKMAELFCGPGGLAYGALLANVTDSSGVKYRLKSVWANDIDKNSCNTYARNLQISDCQKTDGCRILHAGTWSFL